MKTPPTGGASFDLSDSAHLSIGQVFMPSRG
jgi:hypothetical protein